MPRYDAVVTDASPLISLENLADGFSLLEHTTSKLVVPESVAQEVSYFLREDVDYFDHHRIRQVVEVEVVPTSEIRLSEDRANELGTLGLGELYAIELAITRRNPLLVEERRARRLARDAGLRVFGAAAVVKIAREEGGIGYEYALEQLHALHRANRINKKVLERMLVALDR